MPSSASKKAKPSGGSKPTNGGGVKQAPATKATSTNGSRPSSSTVASETTPKRSLYSVASEVERVKRFLVAPEEPDEPEEEGSQAEHHVSDGTKVQKDIVFPKSEYEYDRSLEPVQTVRGFTSKIHALIASERAKSTSRESDASESKSEEGFIALPPVEVTKRVKDKTTSDPLRGDDTASTEDDDGNAASGAAAAGSSSRFKGRWRVGTEGEAQVRSGMVHLHNELVAYMDHVAPSGSDARAREHIVSTVRSLCSEFWPQSETKVFGSCATGLCLPDSDVDVCVLNVPAMAIHRVANTLRSRNLVDMLQKLDNANVPIVKLKLRNSPFTADVSFNQVGGLTTADFIKRCMDAMPEIKPLVLAVKHFLGQRDLNETYRGGMGSYLCFLTVVAVCQRARRLKPEGPENLGKLLLDYFDFYGNVLNYDEVGLSLLEGGRLFRKSDRRGFASEKDRGNLSLWLEDPMNTDSNVGSKAYKVSLVKHAFSVAHSALVSKVREFDRGGFKGSILATVIRLDPTEAAASAFNGKIITFEDDEDDGDSSFTPSDLDGDSDEDAL